VFVDSAPEFFPPQPKIIDFSEVDVILISNYLCMLALPFITEGTGFAGVVYATEPTLQIGRSVECHIQKESWDSSIWMMVYDCQWGERCFSPYNIQTRSGAHPTSYQFT
jgi:hypothetical protein